MIWKTLLSAKRKGQAVELASETSRSAFEQDYDRIIFSHPFRRLQDKTQVHPLPEHDFVHTRLNSSYRRIDFRNHPLIDNPQPLEFRNEFAILHSKFLG